MAYQNKKQKPKTLHHSSDPICCIDNAGYLTSVPQKNSKKDLTLFIYLFFPTVQQGDQVLSDTDCVLSPCCLVTAHTLYYLRFLRYACGLLLCWELKAHLLGWLQAQCVSSSLPIAFVTSCPRPAFLLCLAVFSQMWGHS